MSAADRRDLIRHLGKAGVLALDTDPDNVLVYLCDAHGIDV